MSVPRETMPGGPAATVIIPTYNRAELLQRSLDSLAAQDTSDFEVIVVDDGSTDHTAEVAAGMAGQLRLSYLTQAKLGFGAARARNVGIRNAASEICIMLDCGVLAGTDFVSEHVRAHRSGPDRRVVVGYTWAYRASLPVAPAVREAIDPGDVDASIRRLALLPPDGRDVRDDFFYDEHGDELAAQPAPWVTMWACNVSMQRADLFTVGLFDEGFRSWGFEDLDLGYRLFRSGCEFALSRSAAAVHLPHDVDEAENQRSDHENKLYFHSKFRNQVSRLALETQYNLQINGLLKRETAYAAAGPDSEGSAARS